MSATKFTPGPWELSLEVPNWGEGDDDPEFYSVYIGKECVDIPTDNAKADAHLIAAAPDLYAAATKALSVHEDIGCSCAGCAALRVALAKARGEA